MDSDGEKLVGLLPPDRDRSACNDKLLSRRARAKALFLDKGEGDEMTKTEMEDPAHARCSNVFTLKR